MRPAVFLRVGATQRVLGQVIEPAEIPELLRYVADYYDDNPDECAELFTGTQTSAGSQWRAGERYLVDPFGGDSSAR